MTTAKTETVTCSANDCDATAEWPVSKRATRIPAGWLRAEVVNRDTGKARHVHGCADHAAALARVLGGMKAAP